MSLHVITVAYNSSRHNCYNMDRGTSQLDCYERAFIDDSLSLSELKRKKKKSSSGGVITKKRVVLVGVTYNAYNVRCEVNLVVIACCALAPITRYGSTLYIGIAMVFVFSPYIRKFSSYFHFQVIVDFIALNV